MIKFPSFCLFVTVILFETVFGYQFRFNLPESDEECFGQELEVGTKVGVSYRVKLASAKHSFFREKNILRVNCAFYAILRVKDTFYV